MGPVKPEDVLEFWTDAGPKKWWKKDPQFDAEIARLFGGTHAEASTGLLDDWAKEPNSCLALIIILDQFSRNLFRNDARSFAQDGQCVAVTKDAIANGFDKKMPEAIASFCYLPLMHSEDLADQNLCLDLMEKTGSEENVKSAVEHRDIIAKFGRFPHRNTVLGRETTAEEQAFLDAGGFAG